MVVLGPAMARKKASRDGIVHTKVGAEFWLVKQSSSPERPVWPEYVVCPASMPAPGGGQDAPTPVAETSKLK
jgi:hypothetical protein